MPANKNAKPTKTAKPTTGEWLRENVIIAAAAKAGRARRINAEPMRV
jgi:hypothetical protein